MRTNVGIEDQLMAKALRASECATKKTAIESGLRMLVQMNSQKKLRGLIGKITWQGNLGKIRSD